MSLLAQPLDLDAGLALALLDSQTEVLGLAATGAPLAHMLDRITLSLEHLMPGSRCSVLLLDAASGSLRHGSAPSLPAAYLAAIDGLVPGPRQGSCGTAAHTGRPVVAEDITVDPRWEAFRAVAVASGLRACWSVPILGRTGAPVGTFAVYHAEPHRPTAREQQVVDRLCHLASVAIDHATVFGALAVSEERFRRAFDDNAVAMALVSPTGLISRANPALLRLVGLVEDLVQGTSFAALLAAADRPAWHAAAERVSAAPDQVVHLTCGLADSPRTVVSASISVVRGASGEPVQLSVNLLDVTARTAAQADRRARREAEVARRAAEQASRAKSEFLTAVSHEMRTPLQAITGFAELLDTPALPADRRSQAPARIASAAAHLLSLVNDTLDIARIEAGVLPVELGPVRLEPLITEVVELLGPLGRRHEVTLLAGPCDAVALADPRRLRQVLLNLLANAVRHGGPGGTVVTGAVAHGERVVITVSDSGCGIPADGLDRLFTPFERLGRPATPAGEDDGAGLGLVLSRGLAEAMRGSLCLDSAVGIGTVAAVDLPAGPREVAPVRSHP